MPAYPRLKTPGNPIDYLDREKIEALKVDTRLNNWEESFILDISSYDYLTLRQKEVLHKMADKYQV